MKKCISIKINNKKFTKDAIVTDEKIIYYDNNIKTIINTKDLFIKRISNEYTLFVPLKLNKNTIGSLIMNDKALNLNIYTTNLIISKNSLYLKYKVENDDYIEIKIIM